MNATQNINVGTVARSNIADVILGCSLVTGTLVEREIKFMVGKLRCIFPLVRDQKV